MVSHPPRSWAYSWLRKPPPWYCALMCQPLSPPPSTREPSTLLEPRWMKQQCWPPSFHPTTGHFSPCWYPVYFPSNQSCANLPLNLAQHSADACSCANSLQGGALISILLKSPPQTYKTLRWCMFLRKLHGWSPHEHHAQISPSSMSASSQLVS